MDYVTQSIVSLVALPLGFVSGLCSATIYFCQTQFLLLLEIRRSLCKLNAFQISIPGDRLPLGNARERERERRDVFRTGTVEA